METTKKALLVLGGHLSVFCASLDRQAGGGGMRKHRTIIQIRGALECAPPSLKGHSGLPASTEVEIFYGLHTLGSLHSLRGSLWRVQVASLPLFLV